MDVNELAEIVNEPHQHMFQIKHNRNLQHFNNDLRCDNVDPVDNENNEDS